MLIERKVDIVKLEDVAIGTPFMMDNSLCIKIEKGDVDVIQQGVNCLVLDLQYNTLKSIRCIEKVELVNAKIVIE